MTTRAQGPESVPPVGFGPKFLNLLHQLGDQVHLTARSRHHRERERSCLVSNLADRQNASDQLDEAFSQIQESRVRSDKEFDSTLEDILDGLQRGRETFLAGSGFLTESVQVGACSVDLADGGASEFGQVHAGSVAASGAES